MRMGQRSPNYGVGPLASTQMMQPGRGGEGLTPTLRAHTAHVSTCRRAAVFYQGRWLAGPAAGLSCIGPVAALACLSSEWPRPPSAGETPMLDRPTNLQQYQTYIDGKWCDAASGKRFQTFDPY